MFRLPRKIKKKLKKEIYLYPSDKDGNSIMAFPYRNEEDYRAYKKGIVKPLIDKKNLRDRKKMWEEKYLKENDLTKEEIYEAVDNVFAEDYKERAKKVFIKAKENKCKDYLIFVNSWIHTKNGDDCSNNMCLAYDTLCEKYNY